MSNVTALAVDTADSSVIVKPVADTDVAEAEPTLPKSALTTTLGRAVNRPDGKLIPVTFL